MKLNYLIEIGTEELPPSELKSLGLNFKKNMQEDLEKNHINFSEVLWYATPRRLAIEIVDIAENQQNIVEEKKGPSKKAAFDNDGNFTKAALGWAKSNQVELSDISFIETPKGEWLFLKKEIKGRPVKEIIGDISLNAFKKVHVAKAMRWGQNDFTFARPVKTLTMMLGDKLINGDIFGISSSNKIFGHRFMGEQIIELDKASHYEKTLENKGFVIPCFNKRQNIILKESESIAKSLNGNIKVSDDLLDEVTSLVEWPKVLKASFEDRFLDVPKEALVSTMEKDQKYFPIYDNNHELKPNFIFVSNIDTENNKSIITGNEKVIRPRLSDAEFFFNSDRKCSLESYLSLQKDTLFQKQLGTLMDRTTRLVELSGHLNLCISGDKLLIERAALLSKCDLMTSMVFELPELQGIAGKYYAQLDNESPEVALAIAEQYSPKNNQDDVPKSKTSIALALADKFDLLTGIFGIGLQPKGTNDPYALRRAANGIIKIILANKISINLNKILTISNNTYKINLESKNLIENIFDFILTRYKNYLLDEGFTVDVINAVFAGDSYNLLDIYHKIKGLTEFKSHNDIEDFFDINKRLKNIVEKNAKNINVSNKKEIVLNNEFELNLYNKINDIQMRAKVSSENNNYVDVFNNILEIKTELNIFFDNVMVMSDNLNERENRLTLLKRIHVFISQFADISQLSL